MSPADWAASTDPEPMLGTVLPSASDRKRRLFAVACCRQADWLLDLYKGYGVDERIDDYRRAVDMSERFADGRATAEELSEAYSGADDAMFCNHFIDSGVTIDEFRKANFGNDSGWPARLRPQMDAEDKREIAAAADPAAWFESLEYAEDFLIGGLDPFRDVAKGDSTLVGEVIGRMLLLRARFHDGREREAKERAIQASLLRCVFGDPFRPVALSAAHRTPTVVSLARAAYDEQQLPSGELEPDRLTVLADALEESGVPTELVAHLRSPGPHVRGCWAVDACLGLS